MSSADIGISRRRARLPSVRVACRAKPQIRNSATRRDVRRDARRAGSARTAAICRGGARTIPTRSWSRSSCCSRRRSPRSSRTSSAGWRAFPTLPALAAAQRSGGARAPGRGSATTRARAICTAPRSTWWSGTAGRCRMISRPSPRCPASAATPRARSRSFAFDHPVAAVDANIARVLARLLDLREPIDSHCRRRAASGQRRSAAARAGRPASHLRAHGTRRADLHAAPAAMPALPGAPPLRCRRARHPESLPVKKPRRATVALAEDCAWITVRERPHPARAADRLALARPVEAPTPRKPRTARRNPAAPGRLSVHPPPRHPARLRAARTGRAQRATKLVFGGRTDGSRAPFATPARGGVAAA